jgi:hypothetical protein
VPPKTEADEAAPDADEPKKPVARSKTRKKVVAPAPVPAKADTARATRSSRVFVAVIVAAVGCAALAVFMTASYVRLRADKQTNSDDRTTVATTASRAAEAMTALDPSGNKDQAAVIHSLGTGPFVEQYDQGLDAIRKTLGPLNVSSVRGTVVNNGVYIGDIDSDQAQVIVVVDLVVVGQTTHVVPNQYLRVHLVKLNGAWKVDNVEDLNVSLAASGSAPGSTPTTTPAGPPTSSPP